MNWGGVPRRRCANGRNGWKVATTRRRFIKREPLNASLVVFVEILLEQVCLG